MKRISLIRIAPGTFRIDVDGRLETVYAAGPPGDRWAFWNGQLFHQEAASAATSAAPTGGRSAPMALVAPMPATVVRILVTASSRVRKGDTLIVLEAMKMELPMRAESDGTVKAIHCREGELVGADQTLLTMKPFPEGL